MERTKTAKRKLNEYPCLQSRAGCKEYYPKRSWAQNPLYKSIHPYQHGGPGLSGAPYLPMSQSKNRIHRWRK